MLVIKKISFIILVLSISFFKLNAKDLNNLFDELQKAENIYAAEYIEKIFGGVGLLTQKVNI